MSVPTLDSRPAGAQPGSIFVTGDSLWYISSIGGLFRGVGVIIGVVAGLEGSMWIDGEDFNYIAAPGTQYRLDKTSLGFKTFDAIPGSIWIDSAQPEGRQFNWIGSTNRYQWWDGT